MNGFKFDFSKIFWGGAHRAPSPDPSPRFFSGFALGLGFALNSRALRVLDSGFALDTRALRVLDSGFALNFRLRTLVCPPQKKINSWIRPWYHGGIDDLELVETGGAWRFIENRGSSFSAKAFEKASAVSSSEFGGFSFFCRRTDFRCRHNFFEQPNIAYVKQNVWLSSSKCPKKLKHLSEVVRTVPCSSTGFVNVKFQYFSSTK